jgi:two-component system chemotaxis response regulator CheY
MRTLVVDDALCNRIVLQGYLTKFGECNVAGNGREAIEACRAAHQQSRPYSLICMDIMMPEMDGITALKEIRLLERQWRIVRGSRARIIMTTASNGSKHVFEAASGSCDGYLTKPIEMAKLLDVLRTFKLVPNDNARLSV